MDKLNVFDDANDIVIMFNEERIRIKKTYFDKLLIDLNTLSRKLAQENQKSYNKAKPVSYTHLTLPTNREV